MGKIGEMGVKLDMSNAYDRVEWDCFEKLMGKMGFHEKWVNIMMRCIRYVSYSIKINRKPIVILLLHGVCAKGTLFLPICFWFEQKVYLHS